MDAAVPSNHLHTQAQRSHPWEWKEGVQEGGFLLRDCWNGGGSGGGGGGGEGCINCGLYFEKVIYFRLFLLELLN
jgi:hypothetical protein